MKLDRVFLKKLWNSEEVICPKCNKDKLVPLHPKRKAKRNDNCNWKCQSCNEIYRTINILNDLLSNNE